MALQQLKINSIFEGQAPSQYFGTDGTFIASQGIDPDFPISSSDIKTSGFAVPIGYAKFSGANLTGAPVAFITTPKNTLTYVVTATGKLISYDSAQANETLIGTVTGSQASGAAYYNNYIYIFGTGASHNDASRYGPLNNSPTLTNAIWSGATLGSQAVMSNTTYPTLNSVSIPNHFAYVHGDNSLYVCDFESKAGGTSPGQGLLHRIHTKKVTDEGDTNDTTVPSAYAALRLPFGFYPTSITNYSTNIMIVGIYTTDSTVNQGQAAFILWDTTSSNFYLGPVPLPDPLATACLNKSGTVYIWSGNAQNGVRLSQYFYGEVTKDIAFMEEGLPPLAYAVGAVGNRLVWGGTSTNPNTRSCVYAYGSKDARLPAGVQNVIITSNSSTTPLVTALKYVQQASYKQPQILVGWNDGSGAGADKYSATATLASVIRWMFNVGQRFSIENIRIPLAGAVNSTTTITPTVYFDDLTITKSPTVINNTNYPAKRKAIYIGADLKDYYGDNNFVLELAWTNTNPLPVALPISIWIDIKPSEK